MKKLEKMDDGEVLDAFVNMLDTRVTITTGFVLDNESNLLTHQYIKLKCGEKELVSQPEPLDVPLVVASAEQIGQPVN